MTRSLCLLALCCSACSPTSPTTPSAGTARTTSAAEWLLPHNSVRAGSVVALLPTPVPALPPLTWSDSAAALAQTWAGGCVFAHNTAGLTTGTLRGENLAAFTPGQTAASIVGAWANEGLQYRYGSNSCAAGSCGHYTQLVARRTERVGCAVTRCTGNSPLGTSDPWDFFVCDYEPPGNISGQLPY